jgi:DnaJ-like protein
LCVVQEQSPKQRRVERPVEERIADLERAGELRGLPGEGQPLPPDDGGSPESWAARRIVKNAGAAPEWADLRKEIDMRASRIRLRLRAHREWLHDRTRLLAELPAERILATAHATTERDLRVRSELEAAISEVNALVRRYDLIVPIAMQLPLYTLERLGSD